LASWRSMTKTAGSGSESGSGSWFESGSGYINQRHGSANLDPHQNVIDPKHWLPVPYWKQISNDLKSRFSQIRTGEAACFRIRMRTTGEFKELQRSICWFATGLHGGLSRNRSGLKSFKENHIQRTKILTFLSG
jgi:hypothetical protein